MRDRLILLPGWGLGVSPMEPLAAALQGLDEHLHVEIEPLPELDPAICRLLDASMSVSLKSVVGGWSPGDARVRTGRAPGRKVLRLADTGEQSFLCCA